MFVGGVQCSVITSAITEVVCELGNSPTGTQEIVVNVIPFGKFVNYEFIPFLTPSNLSVMNKVSLIVWLCVVRRFSEIRNFLKSSVS